MKVLITGGNGFIGSHLAEALIKKGDSVSLFDLNFNSNTDSLDCNKIKGDIRSYKTVKSAIEKNNVVFHLAAVSRVVWGQREPYRCWKTNVLGTLNVLETCRKEGNDKIVFYASSREVYGEPEYIPVREDHPRNPKSIYGVSKLNAELACLSYRQNFGTRVVIVRFSNVYGSEKDRMGRVTPKFMVNALRDEDIVLYGGDQVLDFSFIDDTVLGLVSAYQKSLECNCEIFGEDFHFVSGKGVSIKELAEIIAKMCSSSSKIIKAEPREFETKRFIGDQTKANHTLGYRAEIPLEKGLRILKCRLENILQQRQ